MRPVNRWAPAGLEGSHRNNDLYMRHIGFEVSICIIYSAYMTISEIGMHLRAARKRAGLSQAQLADPLGMSRSTVSAIESGRCAEIGAMKLFALLEMTGLELNVSEKRRRPTIDDLRAELRAKQAE